MKPGSGILKYSKSIVFMTIFSVITSGFPSAGLADPSPTPASTGIPAVMKDYNCDSICDSIPDPSISMLGGGKWSSQDDSLCSGIKVTNDDANCTLTASDSASTLLSKVDMTGTSPCAKLKRIFETCQTHLNPSQIQSHCAVYNGIKKGNVVQGEIAMLALDSAATAVCGGACACHMSAGDVVAACTGLDTGCTVAGALDGATELALYETMMKSGPIAEYINTSQVMGMTPEMVGGLKMGTALMASSMGANRAVNAKGAASKAAEKATEKAAEEAAEKAAEKAAQKAAQEAAKKAAKETAEKAAEEAAKKAGSKSKSASKAGACISAALSAATLIARGIAFNNIKDAQSKECTIIKSFSGAGVSGGGGGPASASSGATMLERGDSGQQSESASTASEKLPNLAGYSTCIQDGTDASTCGTQNNIPPVFASAAMAEVFVKPDVANTILETTPDIGALLNTIRTQGPSAAAASLLPSDLAGTEMGSAIAGLGKTVEANASSLGPVPGLMIEQETPTYSSGSMSTEAAASSPQANSLSDLLQSFGVRSPAGKKAEDGKGLTKLMVFNQPSSTPSPGDVWHTGWKESIFQIISQRVSKDLTTVENLEWFLPLNRALHGLKNPAPGSQTPNPRGFSGSQRFPAMQSQPTFPMRDQSRMNPGFPRR